MRRALVAALVTVAMGCAVDTSIDTEWQAVEGLDAGPGAGNAPPPPCKVWAVTVGLNLQAKGVVPGGKSGWLMIVDTNQGRFTHDFLNGPTVAADIINDASSDFKKNEGKPQLQVDVYTGDGNPKHDRFYRWSIDFDAGTKTQLIANKTKVAAPAAQTACKNN